MNNESSLGSYSNILLRGTPLVVGSSPTLSISRLSSMVRAQIIKGILYKVRAAILFREDSGVVGSIPTVGFIFEKGGL